MIIKKCSDIKIEFYGLKHLETPEDDTNIDITPQIPHYCEVHSFNFTRDLIPKLFFISYLPSYDPNHSDIYEIRLHYYNIHSQSKSVIEKYFEYFNNATDDSKPIHEEYPELML